MNSANTYPETQTVTIPLSKKKLVLLLIGSVIFVLFGIWFVTDPDRFVQRILTSAVMVQMVGALGAFFFGICAVFALKKLLDKKPGLIITQEGIIDNSSGVSVGLIAWADIEAIDAIEVSSQKIMLLYVHNPDFYIDKASGFKRKMMQMNYRMYKSPLSISAHSLQCNFDELYRLLVDNLEKYHTPK